MYACFRMPLVEASKGGTGGDGAQLTRAGVDVPGRFRRIEVDGEHGTRAHPRAVPRRVHDPALP